MSATALRANERAGSVSDAAGLAVLAFLGKGDVAGHVFHGNQWTGGAGAEPPSNGHAHAAATAASAAVGDSLNPHDLTKLNAFNAVKLADTYKAAAAVKPEFDQKLSEIANQFGGHAITPPLKGSRRAVEKIISDYKGDATRIKDVLRGTIEVHSVRDAQAALASLRSSGWEETGVTRDLLNNHSQPIDGYRDIKANFKLGGITAEVQINMPAMMAVKEQQHGAYEQRSQIERRAADENRQLSGYELAQVTSLNRQMRAAYAPVWASASGAAPSRGAMAHAYLQQQGSQFSGPSVGGAP